VRPFHYCQCKLCWCWWWWIWWWWFRTFPTHASHLRTWQTGAA